MVGIRGIGTSARTLAAAQDAQQRSMERLSTGKRINRAADDPARLATLQQFLAIEASVSQGQANYAAGVDVARIAEGSLSTSSDLVSRMQELSVQAQNGTLSDSDRAAIQQEYDALSAEVTRISKSTSYGGQNLLDGSYDIKLEDGQNGEDVGIKIGDQSAAALGIAGRNVADPATLDALKQAGNQLASSRAKLGATERRLGHAQRALGQTHESTAAARSRIGDTDVAHEVGQLMRWKQLGKLNAAVMRFEQEGRGRVLNLLG